MVDVRNLSSCVFFWGGGKRADPHLVLEPSFITNPRSAWPNKNFCLQIKIIFAALTLWAVTKRNLKVKFKLRILCWHRKQWELWNPGSVLWVPTRGKPSQSVTALSKVMYTSQSLQVGSHFPQFTVQVFPVSSCKQTVRPLAFWSHFTLWLHKCTKWKDSSVSVSFCGVS